MAIMTFAQAGDSGCARLLSPAFGFDEFGEPGLF